MKKGVFVKNINTNTDKSSITILCVDDEDFILTMLERVFSLAGYNVLLANSPAEGIRLAQSNKIDVLIADYQMPEMTGIEMIKKIKLTNPNPIKLVLTGQANEQDLQNALEENLIEKWLSKPINPKLLKSELEALLADVA